MKILLAAIAAILLAANCSGSASPAEKEIRWIAGLSAEEHSRHIGLGFARCGEMEDRYTKIASEYIRLAMLGIGNEDALITVQEFDDGRIQMAYMPTEFVPVWNPKKQTCSLTGAVPEYSKSICQAILRDMRDLFAEDSVAVRYWDSGKIRLSVGHGRRCDFLIAQTAEM